MCMRQLTTTGISNNMNMVVLNVGYSMIQVAIGITVGLFLSALIIYPLGKRRSGFFSFFVKSAYRTILYSCIRRGGYLWFFGEQQAGVQGWVRSGSLVHCITRWVSDTC